MGRKQERWDREREQTADDASDEVEEGRGQRDGHHVTRCSIQDVHVEGILLEDREVAAGQVSLSLESFTAY